MQVRLDWKNNKLYCLKERASSTFWDEHWNSKSIEAPNVVIETNLLGRCKKLLTGGNLVLGTTSKYLSKGSRLIEGGCGLAQNVSERNEVTREAKQILDVEDVIPSIFLVEDLRVVKN